MADLSYVYTNDESNDIFTAPMKSGETPYIGEIVKIDSNGDATVVTAVTDACFMVVDYTANGTGYVVSLMGRGTINNNDTAFTAGGVYYSDGDGTISTVAPGAGTAGYEIGVAVSTTQMKINIYKSTTPA